MPLRTIFLLNCIIEKNIVANSRSDLANISIVTLYTKTVMDRFVQPVYYTAQPRVVSVAHRLADVTTQICIANRRIYTHTAIREICC